MDQIKKINFALKKLMNFFIYYKNMHNVGINIQHLYIRYHIGINIQHLYIRYYIICLFIMSLNYMMNITRIV